MKDSDPKPTVDLIKKATKIYPYLPGGSGTSIAEALEGKATLATEANGTLDFSFLKPEAPAVFYEGTGRVMNTIPPSDLTYFEVINELVQSQPATAMNNPGVTCGHWNSERKAD